MKGQKTSIHLLRTVLIFSIWIGLLYPEIALPKDSYRMVFTDATQEERAFFEEDEEIFWKILSLDKSKVKFKSYLLERFFKG